MKGLYKYTNGKLYNVIHKNILNCKFDKKMVLFQSTDSDYYCWVAFKDNFDEKFKYVSHYENIPLLNNKNEYFDNKSNKFRQLQEIKNYYSYASFTFLGENIESVSIPYIVYEECDHMYAKEL
jgi:hypothetical protein